MDEKKKIKSAELILAMEKSGLSCQVQRLSEFPLKEMMGNDCFKDLVEKLWKLRIIIGESIYYKSLSIECVITEYQILFSLYFIGDFML